jgi:hypothetical protein
MPAFDTGHRLSRQNVIAHDPANFYLKESYVMKSAHTSLSLLPMLIASTLSIGAAQSALAAQDAGYARGRILVEARPGLSDATLDRILKEFGGKKHKIGQSRLHIVELPANASEVAAVARLAHRPELKFAELDRIVPAALAVNDPYAGSEWHLAKIGAPHGLGQLPGPRRDDRGARLGRQRQPSGPQGPHGAGL